jgi:hypothetical protein
MAILRSSRTHGGEVIVRQTRERLCEASARSLALDRGRCRYRRHGSVPGGAVDRVTIASDLGHVLWLGGGTGAGKTTVAQWLSRKYQLDHYRYQYQDEWSRLERGDPDRYFVTPSPAEMLRWVLDTNRQRFKLALEQLLSRPSKPTIAEGFWPLPDDVKPVLSSARQALWLLPTPQFRLFAITARGNLWALPNQTANPARALANLLERDRLLTLELAQMATSAGLRAINVDLGHELRDVCAVVEAHYLPRLDPWQSACKKTCS